VFWMPASVRNERCCALEGTAILADEHSLTKMWAGSMIKVRREDRQGRKDEVRLVGSGVGRGQ
jgi:hypothetical protein